jgi:hypothetical protein
VLSDGEEERFGLRTGEDSDVETHDADKAGSPPFTLLCPRPCAFPVPPFRFPTSSLDPFVLAVDGVAGVLETIRRCIECLKGWCQVIRAEEREGESMRSERGGGGGKGTRWAPVDVVLSR